jgi:two-component system OmpR family response regulator
MKLLLVESYGPLARGLRRGLEEEGFNVTLAEDLRHAGRLLESQSHDVILLDIPRQVEFALLQYWRRAGISTPVLFFCVPGSRADQFNDLGLGPTALITKPFRFDDLLSQLRKLGALPSEAGLQIAELNTDLHSEICNLKSAIPICEFGQAPLR